MTQEELLTEVAYEIKDDSPVADIAPSLVGRWVFLRDPGVSYKKEDAINIMRTCQFFGIPIGARITSALMLGIVDKFEAFEERLTQLEGELRAV